MATLIFEHNLSKETVELQPGSLVIISSELSWTFGFTPRGGQYRNIAFARTAGTVEVRADQRGTVELDFNNDVTPDFRGRLVFNEMQNLVSIENIS